MGRPSGAQALGDFLSAALEAGSRCQRIHVIFDRHREDFIKSGTKKRCTKSARPTRRIIEDGSGPLPNFLALKLLLDQKFPGLLMNLEISKGDANAGLER